MKKVILFLAGFALLSSCSEIKGTNDPNDLLGDTTDLSQDTIVIPIDSFGFPLPMINSDSVYYVRRTKQPIPIDGNWDKEEWNGLQAGEIAHFPWQVPDFKPVTHMKMAYDDENIYVIFQVQDRYVRAILTKVNDQVSQDACVEFFFAPDTASTMQYFNIEINCIGIPLMYYIRKPMSDLTKLTEKDILKIQIASTLDGPIDPEIIDPITWVIEYKIPLGMIEDYGKVSRPKPNVTWKANFYKVATNNSNKHYATWSLVTSDRPNFHLPQFFGELRFID